MDLPFSKMHGLGNDYVYVDCTAEKLRRPDEVARIVSERRFGVGSDGLILICLSDKGDFEMRRYNPDGLEGRSSSHGIRCLGKFVFEKGLTDQTELDIETKSGIKHLHLIVRDGVVEEVEVEMGKASLRPKDIPVDTEYDDFISQPMVIGGEAYLVTCVALGTPHAVTFCEDVELLPLTRIGPLFENHEKFPERINAEFVQVVDHNTLQMRVWERGFGETFAYGTGACASVIAAVLNGHCEYDEEIKVRLPSGELYVTYRGNGTVVLKGPATHVFDGVISLNI